ncbi:PREDICTED: uncharacterized protein LOC106792324 [Polistes canadensis]|uniref:uncharacterized protein LOC106792324 n=1 Tax=Polistes canadensis TaxID=91411 RepID=UPI000718E9C0|nr:PREDICTED: uncharacterized protein LOC106792324 [Polistes canadensis]
MEDNKIEEKEKTKGKEFRSVIDKLYDKNDLENKFTDQCYNGIEKKLDDIFEKDSNPLSEFQKKLLYFLYLPIHTNNEVLEKQDWLDIVKFEKGQQFARDNLTGIFLSQLYGLICLLCHQDGLNTLIMTQKSHTPYLAFKRYLSTSEYIRNWYKENPWNKDTKAHKGILNVRKMHFGVRTKLVGIDENKIKEISAIKNPHCPVFQPIIDDFSTRLPNDSFSDYWYEKYYHNGISTKTSKLRSLNQMDTSYTLFGFMGFAILYPSYFGIDENDDESLENFCYVWRCIGYLLGVDDQTNICCGSLKEIKNRCQVYINDIVKPALRRISPQWEHMMRCIIEGHRYFLMVPSFETIILLFSEMLDLQMPAFYSSLTFLQRMEYYYMKYFLRFLMKFKFMRYLANKSLNQAIDKALHFDHAKIAELQARSMNSPLHVSVGN